MIRVLQPLVPKSCDEFETDLVLYAYGKISTDERAGIEAHLDACAACRARQDRLLEELATAPLDFPPQQFWDDYSQEMRDKLGKLEGQRRRKRSWLAPRSFGGITAMAAGIVLVIALGLSLKDSLFSSPDDYQDDAIIEVLPIVQNLEFFESMHYLEMMEQDPGERVKSSDARREPALPQPTLWLARASDCTHASCNTRILGKEEV